jgi:TRAP-type C4-dicarboxylate transport system permease small subunit
VSSILKKLDLAVFLVCKWGVIIAIITLFLLLFAGVVTRLVPFISITGYDEIIEFAFGWLTFLGAVALWRDGTLYRVMIVPTLAPDYVQRPVEFCIRILMLGVALVLLIKGTEFALGSGERTPFLRLDKIYWYAAVPTAGLLMTIYSLVGLIRLTLGYGKTIDSDADSLN